MICTKILHYSLLLNLQPIKYILADVLNCIVSTSKAISLPSTPLDLDRLQYGSKAGGVEGLGTRLKAIRNVSA